MQEYEKKEKMNNVSIIIVTYNQLEYTKKCIQSIWQNTQADTYEIVVVDNNSKDNTREWLEQTKGIKCIFNEENKGFPTACNQGSAIAEPGNDILLLNNDTIVCKNSIYNMQRALAQKESGAVGASSNNVGGKQKIDVIFDTIEEYLQFAETNNIYNPARHQRRLRLIGFAMMIKRQVWNEVGGMDEIYGLGNFEDDDICMKILKKGFKLYFCPDAFIFHFGGASFSLFNQKKGEHAYNNLLLHNREIFEKKWRIKWGYFSHSRKEIVDLIRRHPRAEFNVLDIGCGLGATLLEIENQYPNAEVYGIEINRAVVEIARNYLKISCADIEYDQIPFDKKFDYIILADVLEHTKEPEKVLCKLKKILTSSGAFVISIPNIMHISILYKLLHGRFEYTEEGILDRTHLRFFTYIDIIKMLEKCGLKIQNSIRMTVKLLPQEETYLEMLCQMDSTINRDEMLAYQYLFICRKIEDDIC